MAETNTTTVGFDMAATNTKTVSFTLHGRGIAGATMSNASFTAGAGSAGTVIGKVTAITVPTGQPVTFAMGTDATSAKYTITADGTMSVGPADVLPLADIPVQVVVTGQ